MERERSQTKWSSGSSFFVLYAGDKKIHDKIGWLTAGDVLNNLYLHNTYSAEFVYNALFKTFSLPTRVVLYDDIYPYNTVFQIDY